MVPDVDYLLSHFFYIGKILVGTAGTVHNGLRGRLAFMSSVRSLKRLGWPIYSRAMIAVGIDLTPQSILWPKFLTRRTAS